MDILSLILGFVSILQNIKTRATLEEKLDGLNEALTEVTQFYAILSEAKQIHDQFEQFSIGGLRPLREAAASRESTRYPMSLKQLLDFHRRFISLPNSRPSITARDTSDSAAQMVSVSASIKMIAAANAKLGEALDDFEKHIAVLRDIDADGGYGERFLRAVAALDDTCVNVSRSADLMLVNAANVLDFVHYQTKEIVSYMRPSRKR